MDLSSEATQASHHRDTFAQPPIHIQEAYLHYNKVKRAELDKDEDILYFNKELSEQQRKTWLPAGSISASVRERACYDYLKTALPHIDPTSVPWSEFEDAVIYEHKDMPGLQIVPGILPPETQMLFTSQLMHRDLADPRHKINLEADYHIPYPPPKRQDSPDSATASPSSRESHLATHDAVPRSFFSYPQSSPTQLLHPKDAASAPSRKPLNFAQFLASKLRWLTLGEQYDWPTRSYGITRTHFPHDLARLVTGLFPHIRPESGVVLIYSGKDYMPVHRDVSEQCERALASFSLGCDGIFVIAKDEGDGDTVAIRVRSGDCILLSGEARWAWHAMPRTIAGTCPEHLAKWPVGTPGATEEEKRAYEKWKGYMAAKRINISCRQVWD
ncbi:hypothetical protein B0J12DRAFT_710818 [Macrophomina phaseolina]|uniref:Alpha-ketoglutarate-dependent dioxygenase AlkB-like domain-containing protein n=1 Tax=Macrophomina phaseolina TaxID=35725 RepID=A0ABQ8GBF5_9PEZI|nr:hypothetical protein B0J12DRAFT_710818 [Macrophomina phaseolina]